MKKKNNNNNNNSSNNNNNNNTTKTKNTNKNTNKYNNNSVLTKFIVRYVQIVVCPTFSFTFVVLRFSKRPPFQKI